MGKLYGDGKRDRPGRACPASISRPGDHISLVRRPGIDDAVPVGRRYFHARAFRRRPTPSGPARHFARLDHNTIGRRGSAWESHRSEEHTSELQSLMRISYAVFCLKKKNTPETQTLLTNNYSTK